LAFAKASVCYVESRIAILGRRRVRARASARRHCSRCANERAPSIRRSRSFDRSSGGWSILGRRRIGLGGDVRAGFVRSFARAARRGSLVRRRRTHAWPPARSVADGALVFASKEHVGAAGKPIGRRNRTPVRGARASSRHAPGPRTLAVSLRLRDGCDKLRLTRIAIRPDASEQSEPGRGVPGLARVLNAGIVVECFLATTPAFLCRRLQALRIRA
jgi:hypothetical protein